ncbi:MAG TPA: biosynthetic-type acetolactate synthase large subunit [Anaerolineae bacterium]|nr:biosynthetic-type acetolactate synthase large subunit [Anaerolineae bacterium]
MEQTGAEIIWECLIREGVDTVFGYPGGAIMLAYDAMLKYPIHHVLVRHEQGAAHAADGYARASGKVGVAIATSGPGATNLVTGLVTAMMDSVPIVCITGQVPSHLIGGDAFQETDVTGITLPITKHNFLVTCVEELAPALHQAFYIARSGRPGPVLVDICKNAQIESMEFVYPDKIELPGYKPPRSVPSADLKQAAVLIAEAKRPVILAGAGVLKSGAMQEVRDFAEKTQTPVAMTLLGLGGLPASHPLSLGMMGMHGEACANNAIQSADLLLAFGMRFDDRVTGTLDTYARRAKKIHIEIDPTEINKNVKVDAPLVGDLKTVLNQLLPIVDPLDHEEWLDDIAEWKADTKKRDILSWPDDGLLYAAQVIRSVWSHTKGDSVVTTDVGQHQMWTAQYYYFERPFRWLTSGGAGTMGYGFPAAIGAWFASENKEEPVWAVVGDGGFQMTLCELGTAKQENANVKIVVINNSYLGMVRQWQEFFFEKRYSAVQMQNPDFAKLAEAYDIPARKITQTDQVADALAFANETNGPVLLEFVVEAEEAVYPMVPAGAALDDMLRRPIRRK